MAGTPASYNDGTSAARLEVAVALDLDGLRITDREGQPVAFWPYQDLRHLDEVFRDKHLRLKLATQDEDAQGARLTLPDHELLEDLVPRAPQLALPKQGWGHHGVRWIGYTAAGIAALVIVLWYALPRFAEVTAQAIPVSWEVALGEQVMDQIIEIFAQLEDKEEVAFCEAPPGRRVLDDLTGRLSSAAASPYEFKVAVIDLDIPNAFALPGGHIVVFRGLLDFAQSPDEVAGVLAHEMGHVVERHGTESLMKSIGLSLFFGVMLGDLGSGAVGVAGETLVSMSFSREAEHEADVTAVELLDGIDASTKGLAEFFARLQEEQGDMPGALAVLSSHPSHESRQVLFAGASHEAAATLDPSSWQSLKEICPDTEEPAL
jgi:Zn-dependent protease with chaperone function